MLDVSQRRLLIQAAAASLEKEVVIYVKRSEVDRWVQAAIALSPPVEVDRKAVRYNSKYWLKVRPFEGKGFNWVTLRTGDGLVHNQTFVCPILLKATLKKVFNTWDMCFAPLTD